MFGAYFRVGSEYRHRHVEDEMGPNHDGESNVDKPVNIGFDRRQQARMDNTETRMDHDGRLPQDTWGYPWYAAFPASDCIRF